MGLLLGASALTIMEVLDLFVYNGFRKLWGTSTNKSGSVTDGDSKLSENGKDSNVPSEVSTSESQSLTHKPTSSQHLY